MYSSEQPFSATNVPPFRVQRDYFIELAREGVAVGAASPIPYKRGPYFKHFEHEGALTMAELRALSPILTPKHIQPHNYQDTAVLNENARLPSSVKIQRRIIEDRHHTRLRDIGKGILGPAIQPQIIEPELLGHPPMAYMDEGAKKDVTGRLCTNAVFRMAWYAITGWKPQEGAIAAAALTVFDSIQAHDAEYLNILRTAALRDRVRVASFVGGDLGFIRRAAESLRKRQPHARLFVNINLASISDNAAVGTQHSVYLAAADEDYVHVHDPRRSVQFKEGNIAFEKDYFAWLWAHAQARGNLIIVASPRHEQTDWQPPARPAIPMPMHQFRQHRAGPHPWLPLSAEAAATIRLPHAWTTVTNNGYKAPRRRETS